MFGLVLLFEVSCECVDISALRQLFTQQTKLKEAQISSNDQSKKKRVFFSCIWCGSEKNSCFCFGTEVSSQVFEVNKITKNQVNKKQQDKPKKNCDLIRCDWQVHHAKALTSNLLWYKRIRSQSSCDVSAQRVTGNKGSLSLFDGEWKRSGCCGNIVKFSFLSKSEQSLQEYLTELVSGVEGWSPFERLLSEFDPHKTG